MVKKGTKKPRQLAKSDRFPLIEQGLCQRTKAELVAMILAIANMGTARMAPGTPHIQYQKTSANTTKTGLRVKRLAKSIGVNAPSTVPPSGRLERSVDISYKIDHDPKSVRARFVVRVTSSGRCRCFDTHPVVTHRLVLRRVRLHRAPVDRDASDSRRPQFACQSQHRQVRLANARDGAKIRRPYRAVAARDER